MLIFERSNTHKELCCFDISLKSDLTVDVKPICITYNEVTATLGLSCIDPTYLLDNTGVIFKLKRGIGEIKLSYVEAPSRDTDIYRGLVTNSNYNWCVWCLITPELATNETIHENMKFTMFPVFEKGTFSDGGTNNSSFTFGTYPKVLYQDYEHFTEEFMRASRPGRDENGVNASLTETIEQQQHLVVSAADFNLTDFDNMLTNNTDTLRAITRADYDIVNIFIAQMVSFAHIGIRFRNSYMGTIQTAICDSTEKYRNLKQTERHFRNLEMETNEERRLWKSNWEAYVYGVIFDGYRIQKIAAQLGLNPRNLGNFQTEMNAPSYNEADLMTFFTNLTTKIAKGEMKIQDSFIIYSNEETEKTSRSPTSIPTDIMLTKHYGNLADVITYQMLLAFDRLKNRARFQVQYKINWAVVKERANRPIKVDPNMLGAKVDEKNKVELGGLIAWLMNSSKFAGGLGKCRNLIPELEQNISDLHSTQTEANIMGSIEKLVETYRKMCKTIVSEDASQENQLKLKIPLGNLRTICFIAIMTRLKNGSWTCKEAQEKAMSCTRTTKENGEEFLKEQEEEHIIDQAKGLENLRIQEKNEIRKKFADDDTCKTVTVSDLINLSEQQEKETNPEIITDLVKNFVQYTDSSAELTGQNSKYKKHLGELTIKVFRGKFHDLEYKEFRTTEAMDQFLHFDKQHAAMLEFLRMKGKVIPKSGVEVTVGKPLKGFNPFTKAPINLQFDDVEPPEISVSMLPTKKPPMPIFPKKRSAQSMTMKSFIKIKGKQWFEKNGIENPNLKSRYLYRMWDEGGDQLPVFMEWFPVETILSINSDAAFKRFVEDIILKYDKPTGDRTYLYQGLTRKSYQKTWESIEAYVMRMRLYFLKWKQIKEIPEGSREMIEFTNAVVHKLADKTIREKITNSTDQVGLVQDGRLDDIIRFINDTRRGQDYIRQQKQIYGGAGANSFSTNRRDRYSSYNSQEKRFSKRFIHIVENTDLSTHELDGGHLRDNECADPDETEFHVCNQVDAIINRECAEENPGKQEVNFSQRFDKNKKFGKNKGFQDFKNKGQNSRGKGLNKRYGNQNSRDRGGRNQQKNGDFKKKRNFNGKRDQKGSYKRPAKTFTPQDFTRQKSYAKRVLGFRRALKDKNTSRKGGELKNKVPSWFKGAPSDFVPKEEYFKIRKNHLKRGPIKVAKKEKNQHKNEVINSNQLHAQFSSGMKAWQDEQNSISHELNEMTEDNLFETWYVFHIGSTEENDETQDPDGESDWGGDENESDEEYEHGLDDMQLTEEEETNYPEYDSDEQGDDYLGSINMNEIYSLDEVDVVTGKSTSTFFLDIFVDFESDKRVENFEAVVTKDINNANKGKNVGAKYASISALWDTGATANLIPFEVVKKYMPHKVKDIIKTPTAEIVGANKSRIETIGKLVLDFSMAAYPLKAKMNSRRPQEVQFKSISFYVCSGIARTIVGEQVIHYLNDTYGVLFSQTVGKVKVPEDHMVIGLANSTDPTRLKVIKFYKNKPTNQFTSCPNTLNIPVNQLEEQKPLEYSEIFTIDTMDVDYEKTQTPRKTFSIYCTELNIFRPGQEKTVSIRHDNTRKLTDDCKMMGLNEALDIQIVDQNSATIKNNKTVSWIIQEGDPIAVIYDDDAAQTTIDEIYSIISKEDRVYDGKYPLSEPIVIDAFERNVGTTNFEINLIEINFVNALQKSGNSTVKKVKSKISNPQNQKRMINESIQPSTAKKGGNPIELSKKTNEDYMKQKFEDPTKVFEGIRKYGQFCQTYKDPQWAPTKTNDLKWNKKGLNKTHRKQLGIREYPKEHPMLTMDKEISSSPPKAYKHLYFPPGVMSKSKQKN